MEQVQGKQENLDMYFLLPSFSECKTLFKQDFDPQKLIGILLFHLLENT